MVYWPAKPILVVNFQATERPVSEKLQSMSSGLHMHIEIVIYTKVKSRQDKRAWLYRNSVLAPLCILPELGLRGLRGNVSKYSLLKPKTMKLATLFPLPLFYCPFPSVGDTY